MIILTLAVIANIYIDTNSFKINRVEFHSQKIPKGSTVTILQISDVHNKVFHNNNEDLIRTIKKLKANIIVITGDLIDRRTKELNHVYQLIENLTSICSNVFFVTGNHEWQNPLKQELLAGLEKRNVTILDNKNNKITIGDVSLNIVGVADYSTKHGDIKLALYSIDKDQYTLLLSHSPGVVDALNGNQVDLILSGHTHGGQVRLPLFGAIVVPDQGFFPKFDKGAYQLENNGYLYIDSGLGTSRLPIRFLNQSQVSLITIVNKY